LAPLVGIMDMEAFEGGAVLLCAVTRQIRHAATGKICGKCMIDDVS
jgi:hypothetical protein